MLLVNMTTILNLELISLGHAPVCHRLLLPQNKAVRMIISSGRLERGRPLFRRLGNLTVQSQYVFDCLCHVKSHECNFTTREELHYHNVRNTRRWRLSKARACFPAIRVRMVNQLPVEVRLLKALQFRRFVKEWLRCSALYTTEFFDSFFPPPE